MIQNVAISVYLINQEFLTAYFLQGICCSDAQINVCIFLQAYLISLLFMASVKVVCFVFLFVDYILCFFVFVVEHAHMVVCGRLLLFIYLTLFR